MMNGTCRLCGVDGELRDSHVLPAWAFRRIIRRGSGPPPILVENETSRYLSDQGTEYLLCGSCEQRLGRWENHVSQLAVQPDGSFPGFRAMSPSRHAEPGKEVVADGTTFGVDVALFAASVVWRASVSVNHDVRLGPYEQEFRDFVFGSRMTLDHARLVVHLIDPSAGPSAVETASFPASFSSSGCREHQFVCLGFAFTFYVGGAVPGRYDDCCYVRSRRVWLVDGRALAHRVVKEFYAAKPMGSFGRAAKRAMR
jgi:hypothetical protein